ncbi:hypothetical protein ILUMI_15823 [Ignelater luminosus]|uniref:Transposase n=1 Tax=Ignelater luminosus TaxID=2038154 RepID=A0A8K0CVP1_IGNLU|nr:hypothetical protein ILUMI_15823 [Ignelater luminosus]
MKRESRNLTYEECVQIVVLHEGWSYRRLEERFDVSHTSVSRMMERPFLRLRTLRQRFLTTRSLESQLEDVHNVRISCETVRQCLKEARSRHLNPIEDVWDLLGRRLRNSSNQPNTLQEPEQSLVEIWNELDENTLRLFVLSMDRRSQAVICKRGGNTSY